MGAVAYVGVAVVGCCSLLLLANGCSDLDRAEWNEEVQLASGERVIVARAAVAKKSGFPVSRRGATTKWHLTFPSGKPAWESDGPMPPLSIEISDGAHYVAATLRSRDLCAKYGDPQGSVVFFRWDGKEWARVHRDGYPANSKVNLLRNPWGRDTREDASGLLKHQDKQLRPGNRTVHVPLDQHIADRAEDACQLLKKI